MEDCRGQGSEIGFGRLTRVHGIFVADISVADIIIDYFNKSIPNFATNSFEGSSVNYANVKMGQVRLVQRTLLVNWRSPVNCENQFR